jgi:hypothetical protein
MRPFADEEASVNLRPFPRIAEENMPRWPQKTSQTWIGRSRPSHSSGTTSVQEHLLAGPSELAWLSGFAPGFALEAGQRRSIQ